MAEINFDNNDKGIWRRLCLTMPARLQGKSLQAFYYGLLTYSEKYPDDKNPRIYCSDVIYEQIKKLPEAFLKGRWLYFKYNDTFFSVRKVKTK